MMEKFLLIVIIFSLPTSLFTQLDDDFLSDNFIENINKQNLSWVAGRNFPENETKEFLARGNINYTNLDEINTLDTLNYRTVYYKHIPSSFDARDKWPKCKDLISSNLRHVLECIYDVWAAAPGKVMTDRMCIETNGYKRIQLSGDDIMGCCDLCKKEGMEHFSAWKFWVSEGVVTGGEYRSNIVKEMISILSLFLQDFLIRKGCIPRLSSLRVSYAMCRNFKCKRECTNKKYKKHYWADKRKGRVAYAMNKDPKQIQIEIMEHGPVTAVIVVYYPLFSYKTGIFKLKRYNNPHGYHVVKIIGWGVEKGEPYWLVAGNMGNRFGNHNGMIKFPRGKNEFEIERYVVAGRTYSRLSPREYLVPSANSENTQLNISLLVLNVLMAVILM